jgi:isoquinoline 1-oxidoreductase beta subunit
LTHSTTWTKTGKAWGFDSEKGLEDFAAAARDPKAEAAEWSKSGDPRDALATAATTFDAEYRCDYAYHAQMEPLNAVAAVSPAGDSAEIWCGTQSQTTAQEASAKALGIAREKIKLNYLLMGGGFGRRGPRDADFVVDAVLLAKDAGRPVKVMWTREDDVHNGRFRPLSAHYLRAGFDVSGKLAVYHHRLVGDRVTPFFDPVRYESRGRKDFILMIGADFGSYEVPHQLVEQLYRDTGVRTAPLRGISWTANKFAVETFIDEIAVKQGSIRLLTGSSESRTHAHEGSSRPSPTWRTGAGSATGAEWGSRSSTIPTRSSPVPPKYRSNAPPAKSRCTTSGARSTAASRCSRTMWRRRARAALSTGWASP